MDGEYEIRVSVPLDSDGFMRRQCPQCDRQFKWHHGPANEEAEQQPRPDAYSCPLCGQPAADDAWHTEEQAEFFQRAVMPQALEQVQDELEAMFRGIKGMTYKHGVGGTSEAPEPLTEPDDMTIVTSPCHSYEPVKVPEDHVGPLYCLICGSAFAV